MSFATAPTTPPPPRADPPLLSMADRERALWIRVSGVFAANAEKMPPSTGDGLMARLCAVEAAFTGEAFDRATLLADDYLRSGLTKGARDRLQALRAKARIQSLKRSPLPLM